MLQKISAIAEGSGAEMFLTAHEWAAMGSRFLREERLTCSYNVAIY